MKSPGKLRKTASERKDLYRRVGGDRPTKGREFSKARERGGQETIKESERLRERVRILFRHVMTGSVVKRGERSLRCPLRRGQTGEVPRGVRPLGGGGSRRIRHVRFSSGGHSRRSDWISGVRGEGDYRRQEFVANSMRSIRTRPVLIRQSLAKRKRRGRCPPALSLVGVTGFEPAAS